MMKLKNKAFTLIELIVVIAIISILAVSASLVVTKWFSKSKDSRRLTDVVSIEKALTTYLADHEGNSTGQLTGWNLTGVVYESGGVATDIGVVTYQWPMNQTYLDGMSSFDALQKAPEDPLKNYYIIAVDAKTKTQFSIWATLENVDTDTVWNRSLIKWNYKSWSSLYYMSGWGVLIPGWASSLLVNSVYSGDSGFYKLSWSINTWDTWLMKTWEPFIKDNDTTYFPYIVITE